jgi:hypothetical protein
MEAFMLRSRVLRWGFGRTTLVGLFMIFSFSLLSGCTGYSSQEPAGEEIYATTDDVAYLAQYGTWMAVAPYGNVWLPSVSREWQPFYYGQWEWTDAGWAWVSYEPYGWLVYHYGNWDYEPDIGWFWIEGSEWSPAPVEWLSFDGYVSWASRPPEGVEWHRPWDERRLDPWVVVRDRDFDHENIGRYRIERPPHPNDMNGKELSREPDIRRIEKATGQSIRPQKLEHGQLPIYMNPRHAEHNRENRSGESRAEENHPEHAAHQQGEETRHRDGQTGNTENRGEYRDGSETRSGQAEESRAEGHDQKSHPEEGRQSQTEPEQSNRVQLKRMVLSRDNAARVRKHRAEVEQKVLVSKDRDNQSPQKKEGSREKK